MTEQVQTNDPNPTTQQASGNQAGAGGNSTFTQEQLDAIVRDRLARERQKFADYDDLKKKAEGYDALQEAQKTELQRAQERAEKAEQDRLQALETANKRMIRASFIAEASAAGVKYPEDAYALAQTIGLQFSVEGESVTGVKDAVKKLVEEGRLPMSTRPAAPSLDGGSGNGDRGTDAPTLTAVELETAKKMGLKPEEYAKHKLRK